MKIIETKEVLEFLCLFNYPNNLKISSSPVFDTQFHKGDKVVEQIHHFEALNFQSTYFNKESILRAGLLLEGKLKIEDKLKIVLYLTKKFHHASLNVIYPSYREILLLAAHALGHHNSE